MVKVGRWTLRRFGVQHHRQSVAMKGKVGSFPFMATDWRWCWTPKRLKVHLPTFTTGFVLPSIKIVYYQHLLVSFEGLLSLRLSDHFALVVGCINNNWLNLWKKDAYKVFTGISPPLSSHFPLPKIFSPSGFVPPLSNGTSRATSDRKPKTKNDQILPSPILFFPSKKMNQINTKNYWK